MKTPRFLPLICAGVLATTFLLAPAHAVELHQKWQAGQSLNYDLAMKGTANIKVPADVPIFIAGVPLEVEVQGQGLARFNTLEVNDGEGTVLFELPTFDVNGRAFGQKALFQLRDGQPSLLLNGKPLALPKPDPKAAPAKRYALVIGKDGRIKRIQELDAAAPTATKAPAKPVAPADAIDKSAFVTSMILQALPTLWPQGDVQPGDTWKTTLPLPATFARDADAAKTAAPLSEWTMTLKGEEMVDGVSLWRVGVVGGIQLDGQSLAQPDAPKAGGRLAPQLENIAQRVDGDLWIDAQAGRIVRGDMVIDARGQAHTVDERGRNSDPAWADFTGTFGLRLRR